MEIFFTTYKHHNHLHYYNIMHCQRFIFNLNLNFMILSQFEKLIHMYIYMQMFFKNFQLKVLPSPFVKTIIL